MRSSTPAGPACIKTHFLGPHPLIEHYLRRLNVAPILQGHLTHSKQGVLSHAQAICILVHNILTSPGPLYRVQGWAEPIEATALGISEAQKAVINDDRLARALDAIASEKARGIWFHLALRTIKEWRLAIERVHHDTTSVSFFGEYETSVADPRITQGHSKNHRPDLKQLVFGLNVTDDGAVPLLHQVFSGNATDDSLHKDNFDRLRRLLGRSDFIYVADCKLATESNMAHLASFDAKFVTVLPRSRREDREFRERLRRGGLRWKTIMTVPNRRREDLPPDVFSSPVGCESKTAEGYRLVWFRSSQKAALDAAGRTRNLQKAELALDDMVRRLARPHRRLLSRGNVKRLVGAILRQYECKHLIKIDLRPRQALTERRLRPGRPRKDDPVRMEVRHCWSLAYERDQAALDGEARTDGVFPIVARGLDDRTRRQIIEIYKYQAYLEKRFSQIKTDLSVAPVYLKTPRRVVALLHVYFIAIAVASLIERDVRKAMAKTGKTKMAIFPEGRTSPAPTAPRVLEAFASAGWHEFNRGDETVCFPLQQTKLQRELLVMLDLLGVLYA